MIRKVLESDLSTVVDIQIAGWQTAYRGIIDDEFLDNLDKEKILERRKKDFDKCGFLVIEEDDILGFCRYVYDGKCSPNYDADCEIMALYMRPDLKGRGLGSKLFKHVIDEFKSLGKKKMILWCLKDNMPSRGFYLKMGGELIGEKPITFGDKEYMEVGYVFNVGDEDE